MVRFGPGPSDRIFPEAPLDLSDDLGRLVDLYSEGGKRCIGRAVPILSRICTGGDTGEVIVPVDTIVGRWGAVSWNGEGCRRTPRECSTRSNFGTFSVPAPRDADLICRGSALFVGAGCANASSARTSVTRWLMFLECPLTVLDF